MNNDNDNERGIDAVTDLSVFDEPDKENGNGINQLITSPFEHRFDIDTKEGDKIKTSYSMWSMFRNCRKMFELRYFCGLVPLTEAPALSFGTVIHKCIEIWLTEKDDCKILRFIDSSFPDRNFDAYQKQSWHYARAMMIKYIKEYADSTITPVSVEDIFEINITNPKTGAESKTFTIAGKIDLLAQHNFDDDKGLWIYDHKTTAGITEGYLDKLWCDLQLLIYARYYARAKGLNIAGCVYDILTKPKLRQSAGETEEEFQIRYAELCAKNKSGKSSAKRQMPETDEEFQSRLSERLSQPFTFHREHIPLDNNRLNGVESEIWELTQQLLIARRTGNFYQNTDHCFKWGRACPYFPICRSGMNEVVASTGYQIKEPHSELIESENESNVSDELPF